MIILVLDFSKTLINHELKNIYNHDYSEYSEGLLRGRTGRGIVVAGDGKVCYKPSQSSQKMNLNIYKALKRYTQNLN